MTIEAQRNVTRTLSDIAAEEIRALLGRKRMSQAELARRLNVTGAWLNYRLTGRQPIDLNDLQVIAAALGTEPANLLGSASVTWPYSRPAGRKPSTLPKRNDVKKAPARGAGRPPTYPQTGRRPQLLGQRTST